MSLHLFGTKFFLIICNDRMQIMFLIILLNIDFNVRNERKIVIKLRGFDYKITRILTANHEF